MCFCFILVLLSFSQNERQFNTMQFFFPDKIVHLTATTIIRFLSSLLCLLVFVCRAHSITTTHIHTQTNTHIKNLFPIKIMLIKPPNFHLLMLQLYDCCVLLLFNHLCCCCCYCFFYYPLICSFPFDAELFIYLFYFFFFCSPVLFCRIFFFNRQKHNCFSWLLLLLVLLLVALNVINNKIVC